VASGGWAMTRVRTRHDEAAERAGRVFEQLRDANEQLILAALRAQIESESAALRLREVQRSAEFDALTALPNRMLFQDRFCQAAASAKRHGTRLALLFLDLNSFKQINDTLGHHVGDQVLRQTATTLVSAVRAADTVSRHGGDEFVVLLTDVVDRSDVAVIAEKLLRALAAPSQHGQHIVHLAASMGISLFPDDGEDIEALTALADAAMYRSKQHGAAPYVFHGDAPNAEGVAVPSMAVVAPHPVTLASEAHNAFDQQSALMRAANEHLVLSTLETHVIQAELEMTNRRQLDFMAVLAHELRNPLAPIRNVSALLARVQPGDPILPRLQDIIERQVVHMARMIDDLVDISRAQNGRLAIESLKTELTSLVAEAIATGQPTRDLRRQNLTAIIPTSPVYVAGDAIRLTQIFTNLFSHAARCTPDGGSLSLVMTADAPNVVITLTVNDIGPPADAVPTTPDLLTPNMHARGSISAGLGIGLTVMHELVKAHGGSVAAHSRRPEHGDQLVVTLPCFDGATAA
jgi:diguanylate cyclase